MPCHSSARTLFIFISAILASIHHIYASPVSRTSEELLPRLEWYQCTLVETEIHHPINQNEPKGMLPEPTQQEISRLGPSHKSDIPYNAPLPRKLPCKSGTRLTPEGRRTGQGLSATGTIIICDPGDRSTSPYVVKVIKTRVLMDTDRRAHLPLQVEWEIDALGKMQTSLPGGVPRWSFWMDSKQQGNRGSNGLYRVDAEVYITIAPEYAFAKTLRGHFNDLGWDLIANPALLGHPEVTEFMQLVTNLYVQLANVHHIFYGDLDLSNILIIPVRTMPNGKVVYSVHLIDWGYTRKVVDLCVYQQLCDFKWTFKWDCDDPWLVPQGLIFNNLVEGRTTSKLEPTTQLKSYVNWAFTRKP